MEFRDPADIALPGVEVKESAYQEVVYGPRIWHVVESVMGKMPDLQSAWMTTMEVSKAVDGTFVVSPKKTDGTYGSKLHIERTLIEDLWMQAAGQGGTIALFVSHFGSLLQLESAGVKTVIHRRWTIDTEYIRSDFEDSLNAIQLTQKIDKIVVGDLAAFAIAMMTTPMSVLELVSQWVTEVKASMSTDGTTLEIMDRIAGVGVRTVTVKASAYGDKKRHEVLMCFSKLLEQQENKWKIMSLALLMDIQSP